MTSFLCKASSLHSTKSRRMWGQDGWLFKSQLNHSLAGTLLCLAMCSVFFTAVMSVYRQPLLNLTISESQQIGTVTDLKFIPNL